MAQSRSQINFPTFCGAKREEEVTQTPLQVLNARKHISVMNKQATSQELQFPHRWHTGIISSKRQNLSTILEAEMLAGRHG